MPHRFHRANERLKIIIERNRPASIKRRRLLRDFAERTGLIYFGRVDQHVDDHQIIRGFTASPTHEDSSFITGTFEGRDLSLVDRFDMTIQNGRVIEKHDWIIGEFRLRFKDNPHVFLMPHHDSSIHFKKIFTAFRYLDKTNVSAGTEFLNRFSVYGPPSKHVEIEETLSRQITDVLAAHFWPLAIEIFEGNLYLYSCDRKLTNHMLETLIKNGTWLGQALDSSQPSVEA